MKIGHLKYHGFIINADNTIFDYDRAEKESFFEAISLANLDDSLDKAYLEFHHINRLLWKELENNKIRADMINFESFNILSNILKVKFKVHDIAAVYLDSISKKSYVLPGAVPILQFLSQRAILCLATNGLAYVQRSRIARAGIESFFNTIIISDEIGFTKPNPGFFISALKSIRLPPHDILCVGYDPSTDIKGGNLSGLDTCWFMNNQQEYPSDDPFPDYIISDIHELKKFTYDPS